jgi:hypothetical protein
MRALRLGLAALFVLVAATRVSAGDKEKELLEKAVKAHGGADALTKAQTAIRTASGTLSPSDTATPFSDQLTVALPDRWRYEGLVGQTRLLIVVNKDKGWQAVGGMAAELNDKRLAELREEIYLSYLTTLLPLQKEDRFTLEIGAQEDVNGKKATGLKVSCKGHPDVNLYFDTESNLLVKVYVPKALRGGLSVKMEYVYLDHKEFSGVKLPTRQMEYMNGKKFSEIKEASYKFPDKVEDKLFQKP